MRRRQRRALTAGVLATALVTAGLTAQPANAQPTPPTPATAGTFTLITGDRVSLDAAGHPQIQRGPGRAAMRFVSNREDGHQYVIPVDAMPLVRDGRLDRRLFDLTTLAEFGYDDRAAELPLLVTYPEKMAARARTATTGGAGRVRADLPAAHALAVRADRDDRVTLLGVADPGYVIRADPQRRDHPHLAGRQAHGLARSQRAADRRPGGVAGRFRRHRRHRRRPGHRDRRQPPRLRRPPH
ncbi:hypothetical protein [Micromonospora parva]|uniref:hypothetical protein n=1 Tax=Micromonospora parva TaxID=1464048 RepID=UPI003653EA65